MPGAIRKALDRLLGRQEAGAANTHPLLPPAATATGPASPAPPEDKSWQAGDQAECIQDEGWGIPMNNLGVVVRSIGPASGQVFIVTGVRIAPHPRHGEAIYLSLRGLHGWWEAACFRKLQPTADRAEAADSMFLQDLHRRLSHQPERA